MAEHKRLGEFDHLNDGTSPVLLKTGGVEIKVASTDTLAKATIETNRGLNRLLSSLAKALIESDRPENEVDAIVDSLRDVANKIK